MSTSAPQDSIGRIAQGPEFQVLVLRPGALGDTILTYPALAALRQALPGAKVIAYGHRSALALARPAWVDEARSFDDPALTPLFAPGAVVARGHAWDRVDLAVLWLAEEGPAEAERRREERCARLRAAGVRQVVSADPHPASGDCHIVEHLAGVLAPLGVRLTDPTPRLPLGEEVVERGRQLLARLVPAAEGPVVAVHAGSGGRHKCWPAARFAELGDRLAVEWGATVLLLSGPADEVATAEVVERTKGMKPVVVGGMALGEVAALLSRCDGFVGNDSGLTHLAAAVGTPTVGIYGPTDPGVWGVRGRRVGWVRAEEGCARPCRDRRIPCECLRRLGAGPVLDALSGILRRLGCGG